MQNNKNNDLRVPFVTRFELMVCALLGCLNLILFAVVSALTSDNEIFFAILFVLLYALEVALLDFKRSKSKSVSDSTDIHTILAQESSTVFKNTSTPIVMADLKGRVLWYNDAMRKLLPEDRNFIDCELQEMLDTKLSSEIFGSGSIDIGDKTYSFEAFCLTETDNSIYAITFNDVSEINAVEKKYNDERTCVAYIAIDNVEDMLQYAHDKFRDTVAVVDDKLRAWIHSINGIIKSYENDKYLVMFDSTYLDTCIEDKFAILDKIRESRIGDEASITVSIGVSRIAGSLRDREAAAREAIDLALQRGGDQAVYKTESSTTYYGGRTKSIYKRSNVKSRTFMNQLSAQMVRADNVLIMGHRFGDFDSFGASVGLARLAMIFGVKVNVAVDMRDKNLEPCIAILQKDETFSQVFVDNSEALDLVSPDTLLILADHNTLQRAQFADIASKVRDIVIIDHHRKVDKLPDNVLLSYIDPSASSTCELVTEMLESAMTSQTLTKDEADILLAGIILDTKQFTRNSGTRTFGAAQYLRGAGASPGDVYNLFKTDALDLSKEARFHTAITTYRERIAISCADGETDNSYRIIASKAADKMLTLKGIDAAFTLVKIGDQIHISGRSNGSINVQLILEKLKGGGHFDVAGAQVVSESVREVLEQLKESIDDYLDLL